MEGAAECMGGFQVLPCLFVSVRESWNINLAIMNRVMKTDACLPNVESAATGQIHAYSAFFAIRGGDTMCVH
jgi:hypothetical protein